MSTRYRVPPSVTGDGCGSIPIQAENSVEAVDAIRERYVHQGSPLVATRITQYNLQMNCGDGKGWHNAITFDKSYN